MNDFCCPLTIKLLAMDVEGIIAELEHEITLLQQVRALLHKSVTAKVRKKPIMSEEGRARIIAAQKRRWANHRRASAR
ncbi:hypothetical protein [Silvibacterium sp.]|uniref:hypothetical protein n=1 Tax=Silvibacterium sp. TaxID=1964179 RepID=UPI0039E68F65